MKCRHCGKEAIVKKHGFPYCEEHFLNYYYNRIKKVLDKLKLKDKKILVAVSGGKDSQALLDVLASFQSKYGYKLEALFIKLGIGEQCKLDLNTIKKRVSDENLGIDFNAFCKGSFECITDLTEKYKIPLHIFDLQKEFGYSLPEFVEKFGKACSTCGVLKRYIMNKFGFENGYDYLATGHNLTDNVVFIILNIIANRFHDIYKNLVYELPGSEEEKLITKIRPQFRVEEEDNRLYCQIKGIDFISSDEACPLRDVDVSKNGNTHVVIQQMVDALSQKYNFATNFVKFLRKFINFQHFFDAKETRNQILKECKICGFPTASRSGICRTCRMRQEMKEG